MEQPRALENVNDVKFWSASAQTPQKGDLWKILVKPSDEPFSRQLIHSIPKIFPRIVAQLPQSKC
jgi:hypothetical protein